MEEKQTKKAISLKTINILMVAAAVIVVAVLLFLVLRVEKRYSELKNSTDIYLECQEAAPSLNRASDYLTDRVRSFAATGDKRFLDQYFEEANVTRRRDKAIEVLEPYMHDTDALLHLQMATDEKLPKAAFSVGAAFGVGTVTEEIFKAADTALYKVKKAGGCGVEFSE